MKKDKRVKMTIHIIDKTTTPTEHTKHVFYISREEHDELCATVQNSQGISLSTPMVEYWYRPIRA